MWIEWSHITKMYQSQTEHHPTYRRRSHPHRGLLDFSATVHPGVTVVLGPEGSGKSTLLRVTSTWMVPDDGRIAFGSEHLWSKAVAFQDPQANFLQQRISYVPDTIEIMDEMEVEQSFLMIAHVHQLPRARQKCKEMIARWGLAAARRKRLSELQGAELKRYLLAQALLPDPPYLLLDEPTHMLDSLGRQLLLEEIQNQPKDRITLIVTQDLSFAECADDLMLLEQGSCRRYGKRKWLTASVPDGSVAAWYHAMQAFSHLRTSHQ